MRGAFQAHEVNARHQRGIHRVRPCAQRLLQHPMPERIVEAQRGSPVLATKTQALCSLHPPALTTTA